MRTKLSDKAKKALASKPSYEALEQRVEELEAFVEKVRNTNVDDDFGISARMLEAEALKEV